MELPIDFKMPLSEKEYQLFARFIYDYCGIDLGDNKKELMKARLMKRVRILKLKSYRDYYEYVLNDKSGTELVEMLDSVSTNVTHFFRERQHFDFMHHRILPDLVRVKTAARNCQIRVWSCAASSGEEIYTILMTLLEFLPSALDWDVRVLGTDISSRVLASAKEGIYLPDRMKDVPQIYQEKYFTKEYEDKRFFFRVKDVLRARAVFARLNLMDGVFPFKGKFDLIFCRNVMIYFDKPTQECLVNKLSRYLAPGGHLFIGHSESLIGLRTDFHSVAPAVFRKPL
ncbi:MAG: protein-glutamate O-methyltransferase [Candidatus Omnitrophota bacterium]